MFESTRKSRLAVEVEGSAAFKGGDRGRCGKTTLFSMFQDALTEQGTEKKQILSMDLESPDFDNLTDFQVLNQCLECQISPQQKYYIFLNDLHHVQD